MALINTTWIGQCSRVVLDESEKNLSLIHGSIDTTLFNSLSVKVFVPLTTQFFYSMFPLTFFFTDLGRLQGLWICHFLCEVFHNPTRLLSFSVIL